MGDQNSDPPASVRELLQAQTLVYHHVFNRCGTMSIACALELGIPEAINRVGGGGPVSLPDLAAALPELGPGRLPSLSRLLRLLAQLDFLALQGDGYVLTPFSRLLMKSNPAGMSAFFLAFLHPTLSAPWHCLAQWFRGDVATPFEHAHSKKVWEFFRDKPEFGRIFDDAMASDSNSFMDVVVRECGDVFAGIRSLVDVGGGNGAAAVAIAKAFPGVKCTVLDLPQVVDTAIAGGVCDGQVELVAGDMFQHIPAADAIFLKAILHDWNDENCVKILKRCKESLPPGGGKLIVLDVVLKDSGSDPKIRDAQLFLDAEMMMAYGAKERNEEEWRRIFQEAGFSIWKIKHDLGMRSLMEIYP